LNEYLWLEPMLQADKSSSDIAPIVSTETGVCAPRRPINPCCFRSTERNETHLKGFVHTEAKVEGMSRMEQQRLAVRTLRGWAISVLQEAHAIRECEEHCWMQDRTDPHARDHAIDLARKHPPAGLSPDAAEAEVWEVLDSIGDSCPECQPE
jgi:hypothetical protein